MKNIYLAGGCFWGVEEYFKQIKGVTLTSVGYANGNSLDASYKTIKETNHAEAVYIEYNEEIVGLEFLLEMYYKVIDPTSVNKQGEDVGTQYRTGIYYTSTSDLEIINKSISNLENTLNIKVAIEIEELKGYVDAEEYHQDYLEKNPTGYCHISKSSFEDAKNTTPIK
ncbi:MAG: peptide-methionine (S)-S-oxide reductase MsrA [bacterium]